MGFSNKAFVLMALLGAAFAQDASSLDRALDLVEGCVIDCSNGGYFQHPTDCTQFIQCSHGHPIVLPCPEETIWDQDKTVCNHDEHVTCQTGTYLTPDGRQCPLVPTTAAPEEPTTAAPAPKWCFFRCPAFSGKFAHPRDCQKYFNCYFWIPVPTQCKYGLHFNERTGKCTLPLLARCNASPDAEC